MKKQIGDRNVKTLYIIGARSKPRTEWNDIKYYFPNAATHGPPSNMIQNQPAFALGVFFKAEELKLLYIRQRSDIKFEDSRPSVRNHSDNEVVKIQPDDLFNENFGVADLEDYIDFT